MHFNHRVLLFGFVLTSVEKVDYSLRTPLRTTSYKHSFL